jgi:hypothetical protein
MCCLGWRQLGRRPARSMRTALASTLARATVWQEAAHGCLGWRQLGRRPARSTRAALASTLARATVWREAARVLPRVAAAEPSPCSLDAGCAGFYTGARHSVARGGTCAASGGGSWAVAPLARCGLCWLLRWRAPRCGERRHVCCLGWRQLSRRPARSTRAALASTLARATVWREVARVLPLVVAAELSPCLLDVGCAGSGLCRLA